MYPIDPLRKVGKESNFKVFCDFQHGQSMVKHDHDENTTEIETCSGANCFSLQLNYNLEQENIRRLVEVSESCYQDITFNCHFAKLTNFASFTSWNDQYHVHFQDNSTTKCQCSRVKKEKECHYRFWTYNCTYYVNECVNVTQGEILCNCDIGDKEMRQDLIRIENKVSFFAQ